MQIKYRYQKGANAERELAKLLKENDFAVMRAAKSGGRISIPDIIGVKAGKVLAFECKTWKRKPRLEKEEFFEFVNWCSRASAIGYLAWRNRGKWLFLNINELGSKDIAEDGLTLQDIINSVNK